ncbi:MAG: glycosyltransferase [Candidatus Roizmanbacteria bacterium]|nr:glycosyltransferase [Candidatus Roizmanbacteria bacterium]
MKILLIHNYYQYSGGEDTYVNWLACMLKKRGHKVKLYTKHSSSIRQNFIQRTLLASNLFYNFQTARELRHLIAHFKPDIAHIHNVFPLVSPSCYFVCKKAGIPMVQTIHNYRFMCTGGTLYHDSHVCNRCLKTKSLLSCILNRCYHHSFIATSLLTAVLLLQRNKIIHMLDCLIFPTSFSRKLYEDYFGFLKSKSAVIHYSISVLNQLPVKRVKQKNYFLYVGRLSEEKGVLELIKEVSVHSTLHLIVVGTGPLEKKMRIYKKYTNISFTGHLSKVKTLSLMKHAEAVIIPSKWYEVLPLVYIESLALNVPVIAPHIDTFSFTYTKNRQFTYTFGDISELVNKLQKFTYDKQSLFFRNVYDKYFLEKTHYTNLMKVYKRHVTHHTL